jgi:hypothetical protein
MDSGASLNDREKNKPDKGVKVEGVGWGKAGVARVED